MAEMSIAKIGFTALGLKGSSLSPFLVIKILKEAGNLLLLVAEAKRRKIEPRTNMEYDLRLINSVNTIFRLCEEAEISMEHETIQEGKREIAELQKFWTGKEEANGADGGTAA